MNRSTEGTYCIRWRSYYYSTVYSARKSMAAHRTACRKVFKFGTLIEDSVNTNHSKFGVSISNSLVPPLVQSFTHVYANTFWTSESLAQAESNAFQNKKIVSIYIYIYIYIYVCVYIYIYIYIYTYICTENLRGIVKRKMRDIKATWASLHLSSATGWLPPCHATLMQ